MNSIINKLLKLLLVFTLFSFSACSEKSEDLEQIEDVDDGIIYHRNPFEFVDLGLSVKWATNNIGAQ